MSNRSIRRPALVAALVGLAIAAVIVAGVGRDSSSARAPVSHSVGAGELPSGVAQRLEATPEGGRGADAAGSEGPASMADAAFLERAYPDNTISVADMNAARTAFAATSGRTFPKGKGGSGSWVTVGPSEALYPFTPFRNSFSYVPNRYVEGGRTTSIAISQTVKPGDSNTIYVGSTTALRGMSSVCCSGVTRPVPGIAQWGLYKSTNGGATWALIHNGGPNPSLCNAANQADQFLNAVPDCSPRGVRQVVLDPSNSNIVYASSYARGIWRSNDAGATWTQIKPSINAAVIQSRAAMAVTTLANGKTRMYVHEGNNNNPNVDNAKSNPNSSRLFRSDDVATGAPVFTDMSSDNPANPGFAFRGLCDPQCWYDIFIYTPKGHPDMVYVGGDYFYGETVANKRAVMLSTDAGVSGTDMTFDGTDPLHPNGIHPDQHSLVTNPNDPFQFFETGDGGVIRSSGAFVNRSSWCDDPNRGLRGALLTRCRPLLSRIPSELQA